MSLPPTNPYQFVPFPDRVPRATIAALSGHDRRGALGSFSGRLKCHILQETPIMALTRDGMVPRSLPASSLRGMIRAVAEIAGQGCGSFIGDEDLAFRDAKSLGVGRGQQVSWTVGSRFPLEEQRPCHQIVENAAIIRAAEEEKKPVDWSRLKLCRTCAMFGFALKQACWRGRVRFGASDVQGKFDRYTAAASDDPTAVMLRSPMPHHQPFYFRDPAPPASYAQTGYKDDPDAFVGTGGEMLGRKAYLHRGKTARVTPQNVTAWIAGRSSEFDFDVHFENLNLLELGLLLFSLDLERPDGNKMRHHYGYGKPAGFGTIRIEVACERDFGGWYSGYDAPEGLKTLTTTDLVKGAFFKIRPINAADWQKLENLLAWPGPPGTRYPTWQEIRRG